MLHTFQGKQPEVHESAYIAPGAHVIGSVTLESQTSVWFGAVLRGDYNTIRIGAGSNVQDNAVVHVDPGAYSVSVGQNVVIGHGCIIHGCQIADNCLIGMGSIIMNGAKISENTIVAAGTLVPERKEFPPNVLLMGSPAKVVRELTAADLESIRSGAETYRRRAELFKASV